MKERFNQVLRSATGYQIQRELPPEQQPERLQTRVDELTQQAGELRQRNEQLTQDNDVLRARAKKQQRTSQKMARKRDALRAQLKQVRADQRDREVARASKERSDYDEQALAIIDSVKARTMTPPLRVYGLVEAVRYVVGAGLAGDIVECGVWRGGSMQAVAMTLRSLQSTDRDLHLYDTYEGMTAPTEADVRIRDGRTAADLLAEHDLQERIWAHATLDDVQQGMRETDYPAQRVHYHVGPVEETIPDKAPEQIALLRLDTDWYESTKHELEHLYHRIVPGGVLVLDDYGDWEGARRATDEFLATLDKPVLLMPLSGGRIAVKVQ